MKTALAAQLLARNANEAASRQLELLGRAQAQGRDLTDEELAQAREWAMAQKAERDRLLAQDAAAGR
jgi:hypothetical protein